MWVGYEPASNVGARSRESFVLRLWGPVVPSSHGGAQQRDRVNEHLHAVPAHFCEAMEEGVR
jgi:hypothetical protein